MSYKKVLITKADGSYCESYKRALIATNNPIQLFNSSLNPGNTTKAGITMTNNGDGTFTFNGTTTGNAIFGFNPNPTAVGHKILMIGAPPNGEFELNWSGSDNGDGAYVIGEGHLSSMALIIYKDKIPQVNNLVFKPQAIDMTAIFGKGNEPKNLAEAKAKFAQYFSTETVYPYNPSYCASPKSALITPTKNLFNPASANIVDHTTYFMPAVTHTGHFYKMTVEAGAIYSVSYDLHNGGGADGLGLSVQTGNYYTDGTRLLVHLVGDESVKEFYRHTGKFTVPAGITEITFSGLSSNQYRYFQIEKGATATSYVPYNYI